MRLLNLALRARHYAPALLLLLACHSSEKGNAGSAGGGAGSGHSGGRSGHGGSSTAASGGDSGEGGAGTAEAPWRAEDLGAGQCVALNPSGQVLGVDAQGSFLIEPDRTRTRLGPMEDGTPTSGLALGADGSVVGVAQSNTERIAVRYQAGAWQALDGLEGNWSLAAGIDDDGKIVGTVASADGVKHAFLWNDHKVTLVAIDGAQQSGAFVRVRGRSAGVAEVEGQTHAFVLADGEKAIDVGTLGGTGSNPFAMSAGGTVVGSARDENGTVRAFLWTPADGLRALALPPGASASEARGVDAANRVLGNVIDEVGLARGVAFDVEANSVLDLPLPKAADGVAFAGAHVLAMIDDGRAVGVGVVRGDAESTLHCVLWSPR